MTVTGRVYGARSDRRQLGRTPAPPPPTTVAAGRSPLRPTVARSSRAPPAKSPRRTRDRSLSPRAADGGGRPRAAARADGSARQLGPGFPAEMDVIGTTTNRQHGPATSTTRHGPPPIQTGHQHHPTAQPGISSPRPRTPGGRTAAPGRPRETRTRWRRFSASCPQTGHQPLRCAQPRRCGRTRRAALACHRSGDWVRGAAGGVDGDEVCDRCGRGERQAKRF